MKVVFLAQGAFSSFGGIQRFNARFIRALGQIACENSEFKPKALIRMDSASDLPGNELPGISVLSFSGSGNIFAWRGIMSALLADKIILGHINFLPLGILLKLLKPRSSVVVIAHGIEVWGDPEFRRYRWWESFALRWFVSNIVSVSDFTAGKIVEHTGYSVKNIILFPNVIDADDLTPDLGCRSAASILTVTRLGNSERKKNVDVVIAAVAELKRAGVDADLHVVGDGGLLVELKALAIDLDVEPQVHFHGKVSDAKLNELYCSASIFALPSEKEGFGIVYLEAWKNGLPVIAAKATAIPEVVTDGVDGLLVDPVNSTELACALEKLIRQPRLGLEMVESGRRKIAEKFNHPAFVRRLKIIMEVL